MKAPLILLLLSLSGIAAALGLPGLSDLLLLALPCALASLWLLIRAFLRPPPPQAPAKPRPKRAFWFQRILRPRRWVVVDGSNVMYWKDGTPQLGTVQEVLTFLHLEGFSVGIVFDANAGYKLFDRHQNDRALGRLLGLPEAKVLVVPRGSPADPAILATARKLGARIVSNDRFRDWAEAHPEVATPGHVIKGGYREGKLWLDLAPQAVRPAAAR